ncbi:unnamed protein product [Effrenium voratum]|nr:unnamed protein product [Effrenium voratum]
MPQSQSPLQPQLNPALTSEPQPHLQLQPSQPQSQSQLQPLQPLQPTALPSHSHQQPWLSPETQPQVQSQQAAERGQESEQLGGVSPDVHKEPSARSANAPEEEVREGPDASPWTLPPQPKGDRHADPFGDLDFFADAEPKPDKRPRRRRVDA